jgi:hypothetical protein
MVSVSAETARAIAEYRFENRLATESEAIRRLIDAGLQRIASKPSERGSQKDMLAIEIIIVRAGKEPLVIDRATSGAASIDDAERSARDLLEKTRRMRPHNPPNGYRIIDGHGTVVRSSHP